MGTDADILVQAKALGMGDTLFKDIPVNGKFRFKFDERIMTKVNNTWYRSPKQVKFRTGVRTAVFKVE